MTDPRAAILSLVDDGVLSAEHALSSVLQWMSHAEIEQMIENQVDWEGLGLTSDEEEEEEDDNSDWDTFVDEDEYDGGHYMMPVN